MEERQNLSKFETRLSLMLSHSNNDIKIVMLTGSLTFILYTIIMMVLLWWYGLYILSVTSDLIPTCRLLDDISHPLNRSFSAKNTALRRKSKNWLSWNQDNVSKRDDMSIYGLFCQSVSTIRAGLVQNEPHHHLIDN
jgi:hypothetical protein